MEEHLQRTEKIRDFQRKLYLKAKQEKEFRFYVLYDKVRRMDFLMEAYRQVKKNKGAAGVDGKTMENIEEYGVEKYVKEIQKELENRTYVPSPVLREYIPKPNGKQRPIGIPTVKDRIVQMSCKMVIEPIFEADFEETSYGFRPNRSTKDAIKRIKENLQKGKIEVYDADLRNFFDSIPHDNLIKCVGKRISDKNVIHLIKMWLKVPIKENNKISGGKGNQKGTPLSFLGFTFRYDKDIYGRQKKYLNIFPRKEAVKKFRKKIKMALSSYKNRNPEELVKELNPIIRGWANYFKVKGTYPQVEFRKNWWYVTKSLHRYYGRKSQRKSKLYKESNICKVLQSKYGLIDISKILVGSIANA